MSTSELVVRFLISLFAVFGILWILSLVGLWLLMLYVRKKDRSAEEEE